MKIETDLRSLDRSVYWQEIYRTSKECGGVHLFENINNFSGLQALFLHWLRTYNLLYNEYVQRQWTVLDLEVVKDDYRCDAFLHWRKKEIEKENNKQKKLKHGNKKGMRDFNMFKGKKS